MQPLPQAPDYLELIPDDVPMRSELPASKGSNTSNRPSEKVLNYAELEDPTNIRKSKDLQYADMGAHSSDSEGENVRRQETTGIATGKGPRLNYAQLAADNSDDESLPPNSPLLPETKIKSPSKDRDVSSDHLRKALGPGSKSTASRSPTGHLNYAHVGSDNDSDRDTKSNMRNRTNGNSISPHRYSPTKKNELAKAKFFNYGTMDDKDSHSDKDTDNPYVNKSFNRKPQGGTAPGLTTRGSHSPNRLGLYSPPRTSAKKQASQLNYAVLDCAEGDDKEWPRYTGKESDV